MKPIELKSDTFSVDLVEQHGRPPCVVCRGSMSLSTPTELKQVLEEVHTRVLTVDAPLVEVSLTDLEFMNSTAFKPFVHWLSLIQTQPKEERYQLRFLLSPKRQWHSITLGALFTFAPDLILTN